SSMPIALICELLCALPLGMGAASVESRPNTPVELASTETKLPPSVRDRQESILSKLRLQTALKDARAAMAQGDHENAIARLEPQLAIAGGNEDFLTLLISAYRGQIAFLMQQSKPVEARLLRERLAVLAGDPDAKPSSLESITED